MHKSRKNHESRVSSLYKIPPGPKLDALTAEKVFGWKSVHQHDDRDGFYGKRQDKAGYWRLAKVPPYSTNFLNAYSIEGRMEQLGRNFSGLLAPKNILLCALASVAV
jgi:hypothetical protein